MRGEPVPWTPVRVCRESARRPGVRHLHAWLGENDPFPSLTIRADWPKPTTKRTPGRIANDPGPLPAAPRPYPTGTPWRNRHRCTSSTSGYSGSHLPSPGRAEDAPRPASPAPLPRPSDAASPPGTFPAGGQLAIRTTAVPSCHQDRLCRRFKARAVSRRCAAASHLATNTKAGHGKLLPCPISYRRGLVY